MRIKDIAFKSEPTLETVVMEYCENVEAVPTEEGKQFFREWNGKVPAKLIQNCIFAGIYYAKAHPEDIEAEVCE